MMTRAERFAEILDDMGDDLPDLESVSQETPADARRFLLVEENVRGSEPPRWYTTHDTPEQAGEYNVGQEYAQDWDPIGLWDLDTGEQFDPVPALSFEPHRPDEVEEEPDEYWPEDCARCHAPRTHAEERAFGEFCGDCAP